MRTWVICGHCSSRLACTVVHCGLNDLSTDSVPPKSDRADAQVDLELHCPHMSQYLYSRDESHNLSA